MNLCCSLESDPVYRAQLERLAAASLSSVSQPGLMSPFSLVPRPPGLVTSLPRSEAQQQQSKSQNKQQSGNANAPPSLVPGREGPVSSVSNLVMCAVMESHVILVSHTLLPDNTALLNIININVLI